MHDDPIFIVHMLVVSRVVKISPGLSCRQTDTDGRTDNQTQLGYDNTNPTFKANRNHFAGKFGQVRSWVLQLILLDLKRFFFLHFWHS